MLDMKILSVKLELFHPTHLNNIDADPNNTYTFDLYQTTCGTIWNFNKVVSLQVEYDFNFEKTVKNNNDMLRVKWQASF